MTELFDLWALWSSGPLPHETTFLWGLPLWWWERVGTVVQVIAILGLIFEIIGERRLAKAAERLKRPPKWLLVYLGDETAAKEQQEALTRGEKIKSSAGEFFLGMSLLVLTLVTSFYLASFYIADLVNAAGDFLIQHFQRTLVRFLLVLVMALAWLPAAALCFVFYALTVASFYRFLLSIIGRILRSPRLRAGLNAAILLASAFNLHFTLLAQ
ncbi:MAG: hypothetical protein AAGA15_02845 [Pseudomonadota bacterium]